MQLSILYLMTAAVAVQAANVVKQHVVYSATGAADVVGNGFGCAHSKYLSSCIVRNRCANFLKVTPTGAASQLGCVKHVFTDGFTIGVTE